MVLQGRPIGISGHNDESTLDICEMPVWTKDQAKCFDDAKVSHASQSFIQDKEIKDIQDG